jgi:hypothetical protein
MQYLFLTSIFHIFIFGLSLSILYIFVIEPLTHNGISEFIQIFSLNMVNNLRNSNNIDKKAFCNFMKIYDPYLIQGPSFKNSNNIFIYILMFTLLTILLCIIIHYIYYFKIYKISNFYYYVADLIIVALTYGIIEIVFFALISSRYNTYVN